MVLLPFYSGLGLATAGTQWTTGAHKRRIGSASCTTKQEGRHTWLERWSSRNIHVEGWRARGRDRNKLTPLFPYPFLTPLGRPTEPCLLRSRPRSQNIGNRRKPPDSSNRAR